MMKHPGEEKLSAFMEGDLSPEESRTVEAHVKGCVQCARALERLRHMVVSLSRLPELTPPADLRVRIAERLSRQEPWPVRLWRGFTLGWRPIPARVAATVAVAMLVIGVGLWLSPEQWRRMLDTREVEEISQAGRQGGMPSAPVDMDRDGGDEIPGLEPEKSGRMRAAEETFKLHGVEEGEGFLAEKPAGTRSLWRVEDHLDLKREGAETLPASALAPGGEEEGVDLGSVRGAPSAEEERSFELQEQAAELGEDLKDEGVQYYYEDALRLKEQASAQLSSRVEPEARTGLPEVRADVEGLPSTEMAEPDLNGVDWERDAWDDRTAKASMGRAFLSEPEGKAAEELPAGYVPEKPSLDTLAGTKLETERVLTGEFLDEALRAEESHRKHETVALAKQLKASEIREAKERLVRQQQVELEEKARAETAKTIPEMPRTIPETAAEAGGSAATGVEIPLDEISKARTEVVLGDEAVDANANGVATGGWGEYDVAGGEEPDAGMVSEGGMGHRMRSGPEGGGEGLWDREKGAETVSSGDRRLGIAGEDMDSYEGDFTSETANGRVSFNWQTLATDLRVVRPADLGAGGGREDFDLIIQADDPAVLEERIDQVAFSNGWSVVTDGRDTDGDGLGDLAVPREQAQWASSTTRAPVAGSFEVEEGLEAGDSLAATSDFVVAEEDIAAGYGRFSRGRIVDASRVVRLQVPAEARGEAVAQIANLVRPPAEAYFHYGIDANGDGRTEQHFWANRGWVPGESQVLMNDAMYAKDADALVAGASPATPEWEAGFGGRMAERRTRAEPRRDAMRGLLYFSGGPVRASDSTVRGAGEAGMATVSILLQPIQGPVAGPPAGAESPEALMELYKR